MAYLTPSTTASPYHGDKQYWRGYELVETMTDLGILTHQAAVQDRLNAFEQYPELYFEVLNIATMVYTKAPPATNNFYLTTIDFSVIGPDGTYPL